MPTFLSPLPASLPIPNSIPRFKSIAAMRRLPFLLPLLLLASLAVAAADGVAYEVLRAHGLPTGLLPKGVWDFRMDDYGHFEARLDAPCTAKFESEVRYNATVSGTISPGQISGLSGVAAQDLFLWFLVRTIRLDEQASGIIHFDVGVVDKRFPLALFETPPDCVPVSDDDILQKGLRAPVKSRHHFHRLDAQDAAM